MAFKLEFGTDTPAFTKDYDIEIARILCSVAEVMGFQTVHGRTTGEIYDNDNRIVGQWEYTPPAK